MKLIAFCLLLCLLLLLGACAPSQTSAPLPPPEPAAVEAGQQLPVVATPDPAPSATPSPAPNAPAPPSAPSPAAVDATDEMDETTTTADSISSKQLERVPEAKNLLQVIREAGVPDDNLTPGRKEQIAVYQRQGKYQFYHLRDSRLIAFGEYPLSMVEQMRQNGAYPQEIINDFYQLSP